MEKAIDLFPDDMVELIAWINHDGTILKLIVDNLKSLPVSEHQVMGKNLLVLMPSNLTQKMRAAVEKVHKSGQYHNFIYQQKSDEKVRHYDIRLTVIEADNILVIIRDTSESNESELQLLKLNRSFLSLQAASTSITASLELDHVLETFTWELTNLLDALGCVVSRWDEDSDNVSIMAAYPHYKFCRIPTATDSYTLSHYPLTKQVLLERFSRQVVFEEGNSDLSEYGYMKRANISALLMLPMVFQNQMVGLVEVIGQQEQVFSNQEIALAQLLTNEAASAFVNARLHTRTLLEVAERKRAEAALKQERASLAQRVEERTFELKRQYQRQQALATIKPTTSRSNDLNYMLKEIVGVAETALPADGGASIVLWDEKSGRFSIDMKSSKVPSEESVGFKWHGGEMSRYILESKQMVVVADIAEAPFWASDWLREFGFRSYVGVPLIVQHDCLGIIYVLSQDPRDYTQEDLDFLSDLANRAAVTIANIQLYETLSQANIELARAIKMKDEFLASMSHELRTPLNAILGIAEGLQEQFYGPLNEKQQKSVQIVSESGQHLLALINDILDVAKVESGELMLDIQPTSVKKICDSSLQFVRRFAVKKKISINLDIDNSVEVVFADARRLKQILINLLNNAVKFTPEGGAIGLDVYGDSEADSVNFAVWDTGIGIPEEERARLFQPFVQLDSSLSRRYAGTGLGLALIKRMTELHGGNVALESDVGKGSRFTVTLPLQTGREGSSISHSLKYFVDEPGEFENANQIEEFDSPLILVVDDVETNREILSELFVLSGYQMNTAQSGEEALDVFQDEKPDLILMDIQMPGMDGLETIRRIRAMPGGTAVSIIALTALAMEGDRERCLESGADAYLSKPVSFQKIIRTFHDCLEKRDKVSNNQGKDNEQ